MNRKLIRPNLADVKPPLDGDGARQTSTAAPSKPLRQTITENPPSAARNEASELAEDLSVPSTGKSRRPTPPLDTYAKIYYYKKQIDSRTPVTIVLTDNEEITGTIEWYDRNALKVNRTDKPNLMLLEHNIKYIYKTEQ